MKRMNHDPLNNEQFSLFPYDFVSYQIKYSPQQTVLIRLKSLHFLIFHTILKLRALLVVQRFSILFCNSVSCRSQWPRSLRRRSLAAHLLRLWVRIPPGAWMFVCCECCVLSGRSLCDGLIIRSDESYRLWRVVVCDQETS